MKPNTSSRSTKSARAARRPARRPARDAVSKRLSPEDRRAQILHVAETLFTEREYADIGIGDVAKAAGITQGLVYHYFESKQALFTASLEASVAELLRRALPDRTLPIPEQFELGVRGYIDYVEAHRVAYLNIFRGSSVLEADFARIVERTRQAITDHMIDVLGLTGRTIPVTLLSLRGYLGFTEYAILHWLEHGQVTRQELERLIFAMIITALRSGFEADKDIPLTPAQLAEFERNYKRHFGLG